MTCPKCGLPRMLHDRVCRRCKYFFDEDRHIEVIPPRAGPGAPAAAVRRRIGAALGGARFGGPVAFLAGLIPGLGHLMLDLRMRALLFACGVPLLLGLSVLWFGDTPGQVLFGLAVSLHAYSLYDLTAWSTSPDARVRLGALGGILTVFLLAYWPFMQWLANRFLAPQVTNAGGRPWGGMRGPDPVLITLLVLVAVIVFFASAGLRRLVRTPADRSRT